MALLVKRLTDTAILPKRQSENAIGYDLHSDEHIILSPGERWRVKTGLALAFPEGTYGRIAERSGLSSKGIDLGGGVGDPDYRGEYHVIVINNSSDSFSIKRGDRIAQLILEKALIALVKEVDELDQTKRGSNGFGSTGI